MSNISDLIVAQKRQERQSRGRSPQKSPSRQLPLFDSPPQTQNHPLIIERLPESLQWWGEIRYWLIHKESELRVPGSFNLAEARKIQKITRDWDWTVDTRDRKVACALNLLSLAEGICSQSNQQGGKS